MNLAPIHGPGVGAENVTAAIFAVPQCHVAYDQESYDRLILAFVGTRRTHARFGARREALFDSSEVFPILQVYPHHGSRHARLVVDGFPQTKRRLRVGRLPSDRRHSREYEREQGDRGGENEFLHRRYLVADRRYRAPVAIAASTAP